MASVNKVILIGNLGSDPDFRTTSGGLNYALVRLATSRRRKGQDGQYRTDTEWHYVVLFSRQAEIARDYLKKGSPAYIEGHLRTRKYTDKQGIERWITEVVCDTLQLLGRGSRDDGELPPETVPQEKRAAGTGKAAPQAAAPQPASAAPVGALVDDEDIPF